MPFDHGFRIHDNERVDPFGPDLSQENPESSIDARNPGPRMTPLEGRELLTQGEILQRQIVLRTQP